MPVFPLAKTQQPKKLQGIGSSIGSNDTASSALSKAESIGPASPWERFKSKASNILGGIGIPGLGDEESPDYQTTNLGGQLMSVVGGIPFPKGGMVYHGTSKAFNKFNPYHNNVNDLFGRLTHFAEDPRYASNEYTNLELAKILEKENLMGANPPMKIPNSRVIPARLDVKNALDVSHNDPEKIDWTDIAKMFDYSEGRLRGRLGDEGKHAEDMANYLKQLPERMNNSGGKHYKPSYGYAPNKHPRDFIAKLLRDDPSTLSRSGFDAIKYADNLGASQGYRPEVWAVENPSLAKGAFTGEPLGLNIKPKNLERITQPGGLYETYYPSDAIRNVMLDRHGSTMIPEEAVQGMLKRIRGLGR